MRKVIFTLLLCFFAVGLGSVSAAAKEYTENGISYEVQNKKAVVVRVEAPGEELGHSGSHIKKFLYRILWNQSETGLFMITKSSVRSGCRLT